MGAALKKESVNRLWAAVLLQACKDIVSPLDHYSSGKEVARRQAMAWINSDREGDCSFVSVCLLLGFNPQYIRAKALTLPRDNSAGGKGILSIIMQEELPCV